MIVINFFLTMTAAKWVTCSLISLVFEIACRWCWGLWSHYWRVDFSNIKDRGPSRMLIARQFLWPINMPLYVIKTLYLFIKYKRYEYDEEKIKEWDKEIEELEKQINDSKNKNP